MVKKLCLSIAVSIISCCALTLFHLNITYAQEDSSPNFASTAVKSLSDDSKATDSPSQAKEEVKRIEEKTEDTKKILKEKETVAETAQKEAAEIIKEKEAIEKEVQAKEAAAELVKEKAEVLKKEAEITQDKAALEQAKELSLKAKELEKEADIQKDKLKITASKAEFAQEKVAAYLASIGTLRKELEDLKKERAKKRSFSQKALISLAFVAGGIVLFLFMKLFSKGLERLISKKGVIREDAFTLRMKTIIKLVNWLGGFVVFGFIVYFVLETLGLSVGPLLAGAGIMGLAFGFGGQYLIRDLINGIFIVLEGQYRINDVVKIGEYGGLVEDINLRITTLRDLEGRVIIIPNGEIKTVINYTRKYAQALLNIGVAYKENVDHVMEVIKEIGAQMRDDDYFGKLILGDVEMFGVDDFGDSQVTIKFRIKTLPIKQWEVMREFRRRIKNRFDELGIEIPFPHRTIYWGTGKENEWVKDFADQIASKEKQVKKNK